VRRRRRARHRRVSTARIDIPRIDIAAHIVGVCSDTSNIGASTHAQQQFVTWDSRRNRNGEDAKHEYSIPFHGS
jgi:hypothetical protein